jgi:aminoglycoside phosphotransferase (APT) family kinase protein
MHEDDFVFGRPDDQINWLEVEKFLRAHVSGLSDEAMHVKPFSEGYSNLTYLIQIGDWEAVLRRPPFGQLPLKAHDMEREYRILEKLLPVFPLAPKPIIYCNDSAVMDKHFYVMEKKVGVVLSSTIPDEYRAFAGYGKMVSEAVVRTLVELHSIDYQKAGLTNFGHPEGYLQRQVYGWMKRYQNSKTHQIQEVEEIERWLTCHIPIPANPAIIHNDFKLNNIMLSKHNPGTAAAVFDWELCTIGDPLSDLGSALAYWAEPGEADTGLTSVTVNPGFYSRREFLQNYTLKSGRDTSQIDFYLTFAFYKIGVILQQIYFRWKNGQSKDERFSNLDVGIQNLMSLSCEAKNKRIL